MSLAALPVLVVAPFAIAIGLLRLREQLRLRAAAREVQRRAASVTRFAPGACTLRGVLRGGAAMTLSTPCEQRHEGRGLWLDWEGTRMEIAGDLIVAAGTTESSRIGTPPKGTPDSLCDLECSDRRAILRTLHEGDAIIVHGTVRLQHRRWTIDGATALALTPSTWRGFQMHELIWHAMFVAVVAFGTLTGWYAALA